MGNVISPINDSHNMTFATVAMSRYMSITKEQVFFIRRETSLLASNFSNTNENGIMKRNEILSLYDETKSPALYNYISREKYILVLQKAKIIHLPDMEVLLLLFTILDTNGTNFVNCTDLCIGLSLFASCKTSTTNTNNMLNTTNNSLIDKKTTKQHDEEYNLYLYNVIKFAIEIYYYYHNVDNNNNNVNNDSNGINNHHIIMKKMNINKAMNSLLDPIISNNNNTTHDNKNNSNNNIRLNNVNNNNNNNDRITFNDAVSILQSMNLTASLLGDTVIDQNQLLQLIKSTFFINETNHHDNNSHDMTQDNFCQSFCKQPIIFNIFLPTSIPGETIPTKSPLLPMNIRLPMNNSKSIAPTRIAAVATGFPDSTVKGSTKTAVGAATTAVRNITSGCIGSNRKGMTTTISPVTSLLVPETPIQILGSSNEVKNSVQMKTMSLLWDDMESSLPVSYNPTPKHQNSLYFESQGFQPKSIMKAPPVLLSQNDNDFSNAGNRNNYHHINLPSHMMQSNRTSPSKTSASAFASFLSTTRQKAVVDTDHTESMNDEDTTSYEVTTDLDDDRTDNDTYGPRQLPNVTTTRVYINPPRYYPNQIYGISGLLLPRSDDADEESTANTRCTFDDLSSKMSKKMTPLAIVQVVYSTSE